MGYKLMRRVLADERLQRVAKEHRILAVILANHAHDADERPCCWLSPAELTRELEGSNDAAAARRFRRSIDALIDAQIVKRADEPHDGRPKSRECPRDHRRFHIELLPIVDVARPLPAPAADRRSRQIVDVAHPLDPESSGRQTVEIVDVRRPLHRGTNEEPPTREEPTPQTPQGWRRLR